MNKEVLTTVTFEENCEYSSSTISKKLPIPQQEVIIQLENPYNMERSNGHNYYDDRIELQAIVFQEYTDADNNIQRNYIKTGRIEFYFQADGANPILINKPTATEQSCVLNQNGSTAVFFKPNASGKVWAKYIDDNDFYTAITNTNPEGISDKKDLNIEDIPVNINFTELPPYITDVHDEITIKVRVTNANDNKNMKFGTVTFLHYLVQDDINDPNKRQPRVIGNPVPVINGYAEITYIPVQSDDYGYTNPSNDTEPEVLIENFEERYVEYIRASYNYTGKYIDTDDKGDFKWKYFGTASKWTGINVLARNSITISALSLSLYGETNIYQCLETDTITLTAVLKDKNGDIINFDNHSGNLTFHIKGAHPHPKKYYTEGAVPKIYSTDFIQSNEEFNFLTYEKDITGTFSNNTFTAQIIKPLPGFYTIEATTTIQTDEGEILKDYAGINNDIENDKMYASINKSNIIYISSNYVDVNPQITIYHDTYTCKTQSTVNNLTAKVTGISNKQKEILNNQVCYFYVPKINKKYIGSLSYNSSSHELIGTPTENIVFNVADNYQIYMYIPDGIYTNDNDVSTYHHNITSNSSDNVYDFYLPYCESTPITIEARDKISLRISVDTISNTLPASFSYTCQGTGIRTATDVQIITRLVTQSSINIADEIILFKQNLPHTGTINFNTPGEYEIYAKSGDNESNKITVTVQKDTLVQQLLESSKATFASIDNTIGIYLNSGQVDINSINKNKIHAFIYDSNKANEKTVAVQNTRIINDKSIYLTVRPEIWKAGTWYIKATYDGDSNFMQYNGKLEKFTTELDIPKITLTPSANNNFLTNITGTHTSTISDILILEVVFIYHNNETARGIFITDRANTGFNDNVDNPNTLSWWNAWDNIAFIFKPYDTQLIQILTNNSTPYNALKNKYNYVFDENGITRTTRLYQQLQSHNDEYIFGNYKNNAEIKIARPIIK